MSHKIGVLEAMEKCIVRQLIGIADRTNDEISISNMHIRSNEPINRQISISCRALETGKLISPEIRVGSKLIKTIIADDHSLMRDGLRALLQATGEFDVIAMLENGEDLIQKAQQLNPELVILDITMPQRTGIDAAIELRRRSADVKIVVLTFHDEPQYIHAALEAGVNAYVLKDDRKDDLFKAIESVLEGKTYLSPTIAGKVVNGYLTRTRQHNTWEVLSNRERQVIKLVAEGLRTKDIASSLSLSPKTIEKHRTNLMKKLDLHNVSEVTAYAIQNGLVD